MLLRRLLLPLAALFLLALSPRATLAQSQPGSGEVQPLRFSLHGHVLDPTRAPIAGARVTAVPEGGGAGSSVLSDQNGDFTLVLNPGRYTIAVIADGFVAA